MVLCQEFPMPKDEQVIYDFVISDTAIIQAAWEEYIKSFADCDDFCAQDQICYDYQSFENAMRDSEYHKYLLLAGDKIIGMCLMTNNLTKARVAYCNDRYLRKKYPQYTSEGRFYYVTALCISPEAQSQGYGFKLMSAIIKFFRENRAAVAFDYSQNKNEGLADMVAWVAENAHQSPSSIILLDRQCYVAVYINDFGAPC